MPSYSQRIREERNSLKEKGLPEETASLFMVELSQLDRTDLYLHYDDEMPEELLKQYDETAWNTGMSRVVPHDGHRNSDVVLFILADVIDEDAKKAIKKMKRYQSYRRTLHGWSHYRVIAQEMSTEKPVFNRMGRELKKLLRNIKN